MGADQITAIALVLTAIGTITTPLAIAYFGRKNESVSREAVEVNKAVLTEVKTANAKSSGDVVDAVWNEQIRLKAETGAKLDSDEIEHAGSMEQHKNEGK